MTLREMFAVNHVTCSRCNERPGFKCVNMQIRHSVIRLARPHWERVEAGDRLKKEMEGS